MPCIVPMTYGHLLHAIPLSLGGAINGIGLVVGGGNGNACNPAWSWIIPGMAWTCWMITCLSAVGMLCRTLKWLSASLATYANWQLLQIIMETRANEQMAPSWGWYYLLVLCLGWSWL